MDEPAQQQEAPREPQADAMTATGEDPIDAGEESVPEAPRLATALERLEATVQTGFAGVLRAFEDKLAYDEAKERQINRLHEELQEYKSDLIAKTKQPLIQGLVRLHDDLGRVVESLRKRPAEELTPERFFRSFAGFEDDVELLLAQHGVEPYEMSGEAFEPNRQTALRTEPTEDPTRAGTIAARLRPGFEQGDTILQKERVAVYVASRAATRPAAGSEHAHSAPNPG